MTFLGILKPDMPEVVKKPQTLKIKFQLRKNPPPNKWKTKSIKQKELEQYWIE